MSFFEKLALAVVLSGIGPRAWAQHEADTWYFGERAGFDFRAGAPRVLLDGRMTTAYASAVLASPATGRLQLYSNGEQVWGRDHRVLPNGDALRGSANAAQGALFVPVPGDSARCYLFTLRAGSKIFDPRQPAAAYAGQLAYSLVDLRGHNGAGEVLPGTQNRALAAGLTEQLTAVRHANGRDYWVVCHEWLSNAFRVYAVTAAGVGPPARYAVGPGLPADTLGALFWDQVTGTLRASPDGRKLACSALGDGGAAAAPSGLYDFDAATGAVSTFVNLGALRDAFSPCFSPDNSKLYIPNFSRTPDGKGYNVLSQYDLRAGDAAAIAASGRSIVVGNPATNISAVAGGNALYQLQNGPDGRIYGASGYRSAGPDEQPGDDRNAFFVIGRPNARGFACAVQYQRFDFGGRYGNPGLPNFLQHTFNGLEPRPAAACDPTQAAVFPNPVADAFRVRLPGTCPQPYTLTLYDALGRRVLTRVVADAAAEEPVGVGPLAAGLYGLELRFAQRVVVKKLLKI